MKIPTIDYYKNLGPTENTQQISSLHTMIVVANLKLRPNKQNHVTYEKRKCKGQLHTISLKQKKT